MKKYNNMGLLISGACAGAITGLFGAGGGMVLVPLLTLLADLEEREIFSLSIAIILPICTISLITTAMSGTVHWAAALPYLAGSAAGGFLAAKFGQRIPVVWLHRSLGLLILWGGFRSLC